MNTYLPLTALALAASALAQASSSISTGPFAGARR